MFHVEHQNPVGLLHCNGPLLAWRDRRTFVNQIEALRQFNWVVYAKPPFGGPEQVLKYLARYTHRVAISNHRLIKIEDGQVHFHYKDYKAGGIAKTMALDGVEFLRRFMQHVMPRGFWRIRHFGWMANRHRTAKLDLCRKLLEVLPPPQDPKLGPEQAPPKDKPAPRCPCCRLGKMIVVEILQPQRVGPTPRKPVITRPKELAKPAQERRPTNTS